MTTSEPPRPFATYGRPATGRPARTFKARKGRFTKGQERARDTLVPAMVLPAQPQLLDHESAFGRTAPLIVDLGFGMGDSTVALASAYPEWNILGIDIHTPGIANLANLADLQGATNIRVIEADALEVLEWMVAPQSIRVLCILFPDPWPKPGQKNRRLVDPSFAEFAKTRLHPEGVIRMSTDDEDYAEQMGTVMAEANYKVDKVSAHILGAELGRQTGFVTKYERKGLRKGHVINHLTARLPNAQLQSDSVTP